MTESDRGMEREIGVTEREMTFNDLVTVTKPPHRAHRGRTAKI